MQCRREAVVGDAAIFVLEKQKVTCANRVDSVCICGSSGAASREANVLLDGNMRM